MKRFATLVLVAIILATGGSTTTVVADPGLVWETTFDNNGALLDYRIPSVESPTLLGGILQSSDPLNPDGSLVLQGGTSSGYAVTYQWMAGDHDWKEFLTPTPEAWLIEGVFNNHVLRNEEFDSEDRKTRLHYTRFGSGYLRGDNMYLPNGEDLVIATVVSNVLTYDWDMGAATNTVIWDGKIQNYLHNGINYVADLDMDIVVKEAGVEGSSYKTLAIPTYMRLEMSVDTDGDGTSDGDEGDGDINGDGILDRLQSEVGSITSSEGIFTTLVLKTSTARFGSIFTVNRSKLPPLPGEMVGGNYAPMDTIYMSILTEIGGRIEMEIILPEGVNPTDFIKYGSEPSNLQAHYFFLPYPSMDGPYAEISGNHIHLFLVDGGIGDIDGQANGIIIDPFTLTFTTPPLIAPANITAEYTGGESQFVDIGEPICGDAEAIITNDAPEGNLFLYGETVINWTATNAEGAFTAVEQVITVVDTTPPNVATPTSLIGKSGLYLVFSPIQGDDLSEVTRVLNKVTLSFWGLNLNLNPTSTLVKFVDGNLLIAAGWMQFIGGSVNLTWALSDSVGNTKTVQESILIPKR
jgi:hypothetical protein